MLDDQRRRGAPPIVAILRGILPGEAVSIGEALIKAGLRLLEVPLNSPQPLLSIERLAASAGDRALIGAGTVTSVEQVDQVVAAGGRLIVAPNTDTSVIARAVEDVCANPTLSKRGRIKCGEPRVANQRDPFRDGIAAAQAADLLADHQSGEKARRP